MWKKRKSSVRLLSCFYKGCTYYYIRAPSKVIERSDRTIDVNKKLGSARSCKKHKEQWLKLKNEKNNCELCRGLNSISSEDITIIHKGDFFLLCTYCKDLIGRK